ncbi:BTB/POZ domain-containing protein KCTD7 [Hondaea fermentalgiana]|uniref:BTB/POZ domain-containing protein KCTD7 n=1 Tax=Hondaea fermentalgiana TaxID=2315210 RepID=A0A2R5GMA6_9STRA|nr:BTB/POZ domain-containing protein KCTD7 [Hondaea fermentalgiana]|eukprot:GBG29004.1 BTB/POZ domain-containing protein KCTD7 [Hondaea fermentalgiana]
MSERKLSPPPDAASTSEDNEKKTHFDALLAQSLLAMEHNQELVRSLGDATEEIKEQHAKLVQKRKKLDDQIAQMEALYALAENTVTIKVGAEEVVFTAHVETLRRDPDSALCTAFSGRFKPVTEFPKCDPEAFGWILDFLENGTVPGPLSKNERRRLIKTADFLMIKSLLQKLDPDAEPNRWLTAEDAAHRAKENEQRQFFVKNRAACTKTNGKYWSMIDVYGNGGLNVDKFRRQPDADLQSPYTLLFGGHDAFGGNGEGMPIEETRFAFDENFKFVTDSVFEELSWENVFLAGGSVLAALQRTPGRINKCAPATSQEYIRAMSDWHQGCPGSDSVEKRSTLCHTDLDLFIYGLKTEEEANAKVKEIADQLGGFRVKRTKHAITFSSNNRYDSDVDEEYRTPAVQIILRLYESPAEILMGFDIDCCCVGYDGSTVWALPRAIRAISRGFNLIDVARRSPTYESRLAKYGKRGFRVAVPGFDRNDISWDFLVKPVGECIGLARLLRLEVAFRDSRKVSAEVKQAIDSSDYDPDACDTLGDEPMRYLGHINGHSSDLQEVLDFTDDIGSCILTIPRKVEWVRENPGGQGMLTGSFHPIASEGWYKSAMRSFD